MVVIYDPQHDQYQYAIPCAVRKRSETHEETTRAPHALALTRDDRGV